MCTIITVDDREIQTIAQLRATWEVRPEDLDGPTQVLGDNQCLCNVDVEAVMSRAGVTYEWDPWGFKVTGSTP